MRQPLKVCLGKSLFTPIIRREERSIEIILSIYAIFPYGTHIVRQLLMNPSLSWSLLCSLLLSRVVTCVPLHDFLSFTNGRNLTASQPISVLTDPEVHCTTSVAWTGTDKLSLSFFQNCWRAMNFFYDKDVWPDGTPKFEFLGDESVPVHHNPPQRTPRRYFYGKSRKNCYL